MDEEVAVMIKYMYFVSGFFKNAFSNGVMSEEGIGKDMERNTCDRF
jgi:hypothetical protein